MQTFFFFLRAKKNDEGGRRHSSVVTWFFPLNVVGALRLSYKKDKTQMPTQGNQFISLGFDPVVGVLFKIQFLQIVVVDMSKIGKY